MQPNFNYFPVTYYPERQADVTRWLQDWKTGSVRPILVWCEI